MPRPPYKRAKHNHPDPVKRVQRGPKVNPISPQELNQKLAPKPLGRGLTDSDDSDKLVTSNKSGRNRKGVPRKDVYASGAVAPGDAPASHKSPRQTRQNAPKVGAQQPTVNDRKKSAASAPLQQNVAKPTVRATKQVVDQAVRKELPSSPVPRSAQTSRAPTRLQGIADAETSALGTIKPRRRQPSILHLVENNDSSNIADEGLDDFLPNDESTPIHLSKSHVPISTPASSLSHQVASRKRKLSPPITLVPASQESHAAQDQRRRLPNADEANVSDPEPKLPPPSRSVTALRHTRAEPEDDYIMAPPQSSSPPQSPAKPNTPSPAKRRPNQLSKKPPAPSTSALQALMPTRKQRSGRQPPQPQSEFDIPADSNSDASEDLDDNDENFRARSKGRKRTATTKGNGKLSKQPSNAQSRIKGRTAKSTISPTKAVIPLKRPSADRSAAKFSISQQRDSAKAKATYASRHQDTIGDKENQPADSSEDFSSITSPEEDSIEESLVNTQPSKEMQAIAKKFEDVDAWDMEFEDVTIGGSSSPNRR